MAEFFTDFSEHTAGSPPQGWSSRWQTNNETWEVVSSGQGRGGVLLRHTTTSIALRFLSWDDVGDVSEVDIVARFRTDTQGQGVQFQNRLIAFGGGSGGDENGYYAEMWLPDHPEDNDGLRLNGYDGGGGFIAGTPYRLRLHTNTWYKMRFQATEDVQRARIWRDGTPEPDGWQVEGSQTRFASGLIGLGAQSPGTRDWDWIAVGTDGDAAPVPDDRFAIFDDIEIPLVYAYEVDRELIADKRRTVGGKMRMDVIAVKRQWTLQTRPMPKEQRDALVNYLIGIKFQAGDFYMADTGTVRGLMSVDRDVREVSHPDRHSLTLSVLEA